MIQDTKVLTGGLNRDDSPDSLSQTECSDAANYRFTGDVESEAGYGTNIESTTKLTPNGQRFSGLNGNIGTGVFKSIKKAYNMIYNSNGRHQLTELDYLTLNEVVLFEDITDTGGVSIFNILPSHYFNDIKLFHEKYLVMTDGISGVIYCINLDRLKSGGYGAIINQDDFNLLKSQPLHPIKAAYIDDPQKNSNAVKGKLFQFRSQFEYFDVMKSTWSTISKRPIPEQESMDTIGDDPNKLNGLLLKVNIGDDRVKKINIADRVGTYGWYIIKSVTREYVLSLPLLIDISQEVREAYDPVTNEYSFTFYNDGAYEPISGLETDEPYDAVPRNAGTLEIVNGDILALADLDEGYERPSTITTEVSVTNYRAELGQSVTDPRNFSMTTINYAPGGWGHRREANLDFYGIPKTGDRIIIETNRLEGGDIIHRYEYVVTAADDSNMDSLTANILNMLPNNIVLVGTKVFTKKREVLSPTHGRVLWITDPYETVKSGQIIWSTTGGVEGRTLNTAKTNSSYQLAWRFFNKAGQYFPLVTGTEYIANTASYAITEGLVPQIGWRLSGTPPEGATSYQLMISENVKYRKTLYVTGIYDSGESSGEHITFNLASLDGYVTDSSGSGLVSYDYTEGDRVTLLHNFNGSATPVKWFNNPPIDLPVLGFEIKSEEVSSVLTNKYLLKVKKTTAIDIAADLVGKEVLLEVYTPKRNNESLETKVFFEIGEQFDIVNGQFSVTDGVLRSLDTYYKPRKFRSNVSGSNNVFAFAVEDLNFSDDYISNFWSAGRGGTYNDEVGKVRRKASIRYSSPSSVGSLDNNINRFYGERLYGDSASETTAIHGSITKLLMRDQYLIALQELKIGHIPVFTSILEDQAEQENVAISDKLFNNVRYLPGNIGTGLAKRGITMSNTGTVYFIDHNNGYPCRDGYDGLRIINDKMSKFFMEKIKGANPNEMVIYFDEFNQELNVTFIDLDGEIKVIRFLDGDYEYKDSFVKTPADVTIVQPDHGSLIVVGSNLLYTPDTGYSGLDQAGITFLDSSGVVFKSACITVTPGSDVVDDFTFTPLYDQEYSVVLESNAIFATGLTVSVPISVVGGEYSVNDTPFTSSAGVVTPNAKVVVRQTSSASPDTTTTATLTIGSKSASFLVETKPDSEPDPISFTAVTDAAFDTLISSNMVTISGITTSVPISIVDGEYSKNGAAFISTPSTAVNGDTIVVRRTSANAPSTVTTTTFTAGTVSAVFSITTSATIPVPACPARVLVFQACNSNAAIDDNFGVYLNDTYIGALDLNADEQIGSVFIASTGTPDIADADFVCPLVGMVSYYFDPALVLGGTNTIKMVNTLNNGNDNLGDIGVRNYLVSPVDGSLINPCVVANLSFAGASGSNFELTFDYQDCCSGNNFTVMVEPGGAFTGASVTDPAAVVTTVVDGAAFNFKIAAGLYTIAGGVSDIRSLYKNGVFVQNMTANYVFTPADGDYIQIIDETI